jgi:cytochrome c oxidase subunit IV
MSDAHAEEHHPTWSIYWKVALILTAITAVEVWIYYLPSFVATRAFVPTLLFASAVKFAIVVAFYMHLKYDNKLYRALFSGSLTIAILACIGLMLLFRKL